MTLIDIDKLSLYYGGLAKISPYDFEGTAKYFAYQVKAAPVVEAVTCDFIEKLKADPANAGYKSWVLSFLLQEWEKANGQSG